jgi:hypothetical protein
VHGSYIVKHDHQRQFFGLTELFYRETMHLYRTKFLQLSAEFIAKRDGEHFVMDSIGAA